MKKAWKTMIALIALLACISSSVSMAEEKGSIFSAETENDSLVLYVENPGEQVEPQCQIGTRMCESVAAVPIAEEEVPVETIFLVDNSLSVTEEYRPDITEILTQLAANRMNGEIFTVAVFSTEIQYLLEDSSDYSQIKAAVDSITYQDQETYLTDVLYELLEDLRDSEKDCLKRIVIVSDGVDNKEIGYTKEELYALLEEKICPVYTLGCTYQDNSEELKNMFALSGMTGGKSWLLDDVADNMDIVNGIGELNDALKVTIVPSADDCDGTTKGINLVLSGGGNSLQYSLELRMPFAQGTNIQEEKNGQENMTPEQTAADNEEDILNPVIQPAENSPVPYILAGAAVIVIIAVVCAVLLFRKKRENSEFKKAPDSMITGTDSSRKSSMSEKVSSETKEKAEQKPPTRATHMVSKEKQQPEEKERKTLYFWGKKIYLTDLNDPKKEFSATLKNGEVLAGWDSDCQICIRYNDTVSGKHLSLQEKNGSIVVKNLSRTNPLEVNGKTAEGEVEVKTGDILTLGEVNMKIRIEG